MTMALSYRHRQSAFLDCMTSVIRRASALVMPGIGFSSTGCTWRADTTWKDNNTMKMASQSLEFMQKTL